MNESTVPESDENDFRSDPNHVPGQRYSEMMTERIIDWLGGMARQFETNTGRAPKTVEEIGDHWYELSDRIVIYEHVDEQGVHHPAETLLEVDDDHMKNCIWLRNVEK